MRICSAVAYEATWCD